MIETARKHKDTIGKVYAGRNGIIGALTEDLIDTSKEPLENIRALGHTPAGAFGSCRYKLKSLEQNRRDLERLPSLGYGALYARYLAVLAERQRLEQPDAIAADRLAATRRPYAGSPQLRTLLRLVVKTVRRAVEERLAGNRARLRKV